MNIHLSFFLRNYSKVRLLIAIFLFFQNGYAMDDRERFHVSLKEADPDWFKEGSHAYYKSIKAVDYQEESGTDQWTSTLTFEGKKIYPDINGNYTYNNQVSFTLNDCSALDPEQSIKVVMMRDGISFSIECKKINEEKNPVLTNFSSYHNLVSDLKAKKLWWRKRVTYQGYSSPHDPDSSPIEIVRVSAKRNPIILRGVVFTYRQEPAQTKIYFDFVDASNNPVYYLRPIIYNHRKSGVDKKVYQVCNQVLYENNAKDITYEIFDSFKSRNDWVFEETDFYDLNQHKTTTLPTRYCNYNCQKALVDPLTLIVEENLNEFYEFDGDRILLDENDYLYSSGDGQLFATLLYKASFKEYLSEQDNIPVRYLEQIAVPSLLIDKNVAIEGGHNSWPVGIYKKISSVDNVIWQPIATQEIQEVVQFHDDVAHLPTTRAGKLSIKWPKEHEIYSAEQSKRWCDAAQRMGLFFGARIRLCDKKLLQGFRTWDKLTSLDISNITLEKDVAWNDVATALAFMKQLTELDFCNNSPINFNEDYNSLANRVSESYTRLGLSLESLRNLRKLHIHGLWLKRHKILEDYATDMQERYREFAILTGIINHDDGKGVNSIIHAIGSLKRLEDLSIDDIPDQGFSFADREKSISLSTMLRFFLIPLDSYCQREKLKILATRSAEAITKIPSLKKIYIYTTEHDFEKSVAKYSNNLGALLKERIRLCASDSSA